ncbi:hypothetical protein V7S43_007855 [Phytophthora oleae]|uniref:Uncharacterized protein n=1 Tax=Phytophthora oleae TaxID=2107226 RepID=A0ABD3FKD8_9STRA
MRVLPRHTASLVVHVGDRFFTGESLEQQGILESSPEDRRAMYDVNDSTQFASENWKLWCRTLERNRCIDGPRTSVAPKHYGKCRPSAGPYQQKFARQSMSKIYYALFEHDYTLETEVEWTKELADRLDRSNQSLTRENQRLKTQFSTQENDREFLVKQLVTVKKDNVSLRAEIDTLHQQLD